MKWYHIQLRSQFTVSICVTADETNCLNWLNSWVNTNKTKTALKMNSCGICSREYKNQRHMLRHVRVAHANLWTCTSCKSTFNREDNFVYHQRTCDFQTTGNLPAPTQVSFRIALQNNFCPKFRFKYSLRTSKN